jgi:hypothetical protein
VRSNGVVVMLPERQNLAGLRERAEQRFVQQLIAQAAIEAFDEGILLRLAGRNVVPLDLPVLRPAQHCHAGELGAVIGNDHCWTTAGCDHGVELARDPQAWQGRISDQNQAFAGEVVDDGQDAEAAAHAAYPAP